MLSNDAISRKRVRFDHRRLTRYVWVIATNHQWHDEEVSRLEHSCGRRGPIPWPCGAPAYDRPTGLRRRITTAPCATGSEFLLGCTGFGRAGVKEADHDKRTVSVVSSCCSKDWRCRLVRAQRADQSRLVYSLDIHGRQGILANV